MQKLSFQPVKKIAPAAIEKVCTGMNLRKTMKGSLKSLSENIHWHYKRRNEKGVLEITFLIQSGKIILSNKKNREAEWIKDAMKELKEKLE